MEQESNYPDAYYRVSAKVVIKAGDGKVLLVKEHNDYWVLPGGGIGHGESIENAIQREVLEEIGDVRVKQAKNIGVKTFYTRTHKAWFMWLIFEVQLEDISRIGNTDTVAFVDVDLLKDSEHESERNLYELLILSR